MTTLSLTTADAPSATHRTCCLGTGSKMWPKIYAATSHCPHFPTTQRVWGLHSFHPLDVVAPGVRSGRNDGFEKGTSKNYFDNSLLHSKLSTFSLSPPCQSIAPLNMSSLKPESKICKKKESFANKAVPIANDKYLKHFLKKKKNTESRVWSLE